MLAPFFVWGVDFVPDIWLSKISPYFAQYLFICLMGSLSVWKLFSFNQFHLLIFAFVTKALMGFSQKPTNYCSPHQKVASLPFLLRVHTLCLILKSLYNFGLIFVCGIGKWSNFILLPLEIQFSLCTYWRDCPVSTMPWCLIHRLVNHVWVDVFLNEPTGIQP